MKSYFTKFELCLWCGSCMSLVLLFVMNSHRDVLTLAASLIGATMLIFLAKGNPLGQILTIVFALVYGYISFGFSYYGEMITYLGMTAPTAAVAAYQWIKHPYEKGNYEVKVAKLTRRKICLLLGLNIVVTCFFYHILSWLGTANLVLSTVSVATSFLASAFTVVRSPYYALAYSVNDMVLIGLWILACTKDMSYVPMVLCFVIFLINDYYGFVNWRRMSRRQKMENREG